MVRLIQMSRIGEGTQRGKRVTPSGAACTEEEVSETSYTPGSVVLANVWPSIST